MQLIAYLRKARRIFNGYLYIIRSKKIKFDIGAANIVKGSEWFSSDMDILDITRAKDWKRILISAKADNIVAEHVWEHLSDTDTELANANCFQFLKKNGVMRLAVPDGYHADKEYVDYVKPGGHGIGSDDHKVLYNYKLMTERLEKAGFIVHLLEYWDENGDFHFTEWSDEGGRILRSKRYDERNWSGELKYTSLIVDAVKP